MNKSFWQNKRILINGHTRFKGGWMSYLLNMMGALAYGNPNKIIPSPNVYADWVNLHTFKKIHDRYL